MSTPGTGSPTVRRRRLGLQLRKHREKTGLTVDFVADHLRTTARSVVRWEAGQTSIRTRDLQALYHLYGVNVEEASELDALAREGRQRSWWTPYTSAVRPTFATFLELEADAAALLQYSTMVVPGLLQTEPYMRAIMRAARPQLDDDTIEKRVDIRLKRQDAMRARGYRRHFVIDQSCLYRQVGGPSIMADQLDYLVEVAQSRSVTVQVIPFEAGIHADLLWAFSVLTFADMPTVACIETLNGELYANALDSQRYAGHFDALRERALAEPMALALADKVGRDFESCSMQHGGSRRGLVGVKTALRFGETETELNSGTQRTPVQARRFPSLSVNGERSPVGWPMESLQSTEPGDPRRQ